MTVTRCLVNIGDVFVLAYMKSM